jgi:hypothetical protein
MAQPSLLLLAGSYAEAQDGIRAYGDALKVLTTAPRNWPQIEIQPGSKTKGFLPSILLQPTIETTGGKVKYDPSYEYEDWRGQILSSDGIKKIKTEDRFKLSRNLPKSEAELRDLPYSMRDVPLIFNDSRMDYFKHGLQIIDNLTPIENPIDGRSTLRLDQFKNTPFENNDPIMFGFEIIVDAVSSPLLNGSILDFVNQYTSINEIAAKKQIYEDFKNQFVKFFRTKGSVRIDNTQTTITKTEATQPGLDSNVSIFWPGKKSYLGYYIKKVGGLDNLVETNKGDVFKYLSDWKKDFITLDFLEDVSLSVGTLAHLYKLLYWSRPHGKLMIPENLLRFNCEIIVSECRNFNRTRKNLQSGNLEILKDNLSRYIYSLKECQFWFDKMPVPNDVAIGGEGPVVYENYTMQFDYKYSTVKLERFVPNGGWGDYVGYNAGAIWKIGNAGSKRGATVSMDSSLPKFFTFGASDIIPDENGIKPFVLKIYGDNPTPPESTSTSTVSGTTDTGPNNLNVGGAGTGSLEEFKNTSTATGESIASELKADAVASEVAKSSPSVEKTKLPVSFPKLPGGLSAALPVDSLKTKFSSAQTDVTSKFFDVRGGLGESLDISKLKSTVGGLSSGLSSFSESGIESLKKNATSTMGSAFGAAKGLLNKEIEGAKSLLGNIPSIDSVSKKFSSFPEINTSKFFDVRGGLSNTLNIASLTDMTSGITSNLSTGLKSLNQTTSKSGGLVKGLLNKEIEGAKSLLGNIPSIDSVSKKFSSFPEINTSTFFDVRGSLSNTFNITSLSDMTTGVTSNLVTGLKSLNQTSSKSGGLVKGLLNNEIEGAKSFIGNSIPLADKVTLNTETKFGNFFNIRGGESEKTSSSLNIRKDLLNDTMGKIYSDVKNGGTNPLKNAGSNTKSTSFFDIRGQVLDFAGINLGENLG